MSSPKVVKTSSAKVAIVPSGQNVNMASATVVKMTSAS